MRRNLRVSLSFERNIIYLRKQSSSDSAEDSARDYIPLSSKRQGQRSAFWIMNYLTNRERAAYCPFAFSSLPLAKLHPVSLTSTIGGFHSIEDLIDTT